MGWADSVDRVLAMRRMAALEAEKADLIRILQQVEERCAVVVNRQVHEVLRDVPSWKGPGCCEGQLNPRTQRWVHTSDCPGVTGQSRRRMVKVGGMATWADRRKRLEQRLSVETRKRLRREREFADVLGQGVQGNRGPSPEAGSGFQKTTEEKGNGGA